MGYLHKHGIEVSSHSSDNLSRASFEYEISSELIVGGLPMTAAFVNRITLENAATESESKWTNHILGEGNGEIVKGVP